MPIRIRAAVVAAVAGVVVLVAVASALSSLRTLGPGRQPVESAAVARAPDVAPVLRWRRVPLAGQARWVRTVIVHQGTAFGISEGTVVTSDDGIDWRAVAEAPLGALRQPGWLTSSGPHLVLGARRDEPEAESAATSIWISPSGEDWEMVEEGQGVPVLKNAIETPAGWVALAGNSRLLVSEDGRAWTAIADADDMSIAAAADGAVVAISDFGNSDDGAWEATVLVTEDLSAWTRRVIDDSTAARIDAVAYHDGSLVALGSTVFTPPNPTPRIGAPDGRPPSTGPIFSMAAWWSSDGDQWLRAHVQQVPADPAMSPTTIVPFREGLIAIRVAGRDESQLAAWWSADGTAWSRIPGGPDTGGHTGIVLIDDRILVFDDEHDGGTVVWIGESR